jgi:hypothetical protein
MSRAISLPIHGAIELLTGFVVAVVPFLIGASAVAASIAFALGAVIMGAATGATISDTPGHRFSVSWHAAFDRTVAALLVLLTVAAALAGDLLAGGVFLAAAAVHIALIATTRYSTAPTRLPAQIK